MNNEQYAMRTFGIDIKQIPGVKTGLTDDETLLLAKIREYQRVSQFVETKPGENFEVDEILSEECCSHGWN